MSTPISPATAGSPALEDRECLDLIYCPLFRPGELTNVSDHAERELARRNVAVLLLHHPRKDGANGGRASRGSGALSAFVDILIEMQWYAGPETPDRRRRLLAWSCHDATPRQLLIELTPDGANYIAARDNEANATPTDVVLQLLTTEPGLTFRELLTRWPTEATRPTVTTLHRCLTRMTDDGELARTGAGHQHEPYRYWLVCKADPNGDFGEMKNDHDAAETVLDRHHHAESDDDGLLAEVRTVLKSKSRVKQRVRTAVGRCRGRPVKVELTAR